METAPTVVAFADSQKLRETLSVLLEQECQLHFASAGADLALEPVFADLAVVATRTPAPVLRALTARCPMLPIVAVDVATFGVTAAAAAGQRGLRTVPLEPHAIRAAVTQALAERPETALRSSVGVLASALRGELTYSLTALRSLSEHDVLRTAAPETNAIVGAIMREQSYVLGEAIGQLERFRERPPSVKMSAQFVPALCRHLERPEPLAAARGILCDCTVDAAYRPVGPVSLVPLIGALLWGHLRRHSESRVVRVRAAGSGVVLGYPPRPAATGGAGSWPLLLVSLALQPWSWHVWCERDDDQETVSLCPSS